MALNEVNIDRAFSFSDELTKRGAAVLLIAGRDRAGNMSFVHDANMPKEVLINTLLQCVESLKKGEDGKRLIIPGPSIHI